MGTRGSGRTRKTEDQMYLDHHAVQRIAHILEQIDNPALLMDDGGNVLYPEGDQRHLTLPEAVRNDPSRPLIYGGVTLIGIRPEHLPGEEGRLYLCLTGDSGDVRNCAVLASELIGMILKVDIGATDRSQALRLILRGENDAAEMESLAAAHGFEMDGERCVVCLYSRTLTCDQISQQLSEVLDAERDMFTDMSRHSVAVVRQLPRESSFEDLQKLTADLENAFAEADMDVLIGVSDPRENLTQLQAAMAEAREASNVGSHFRADERVFLYRRLLLERFLATIPNEAGAAYGARIFNVQTARLFNEEMVHTIEVFFKNNLNLSEAARKLYIHRNTLVYRLEKVQRLTGFDLRQFDDAVTFKLMMLLNRSGNAPKIRI